MEKNATWTIWNSKAVKFYEKSFIKGVEKIQIMAYNGVSVVSRIFWETQTRFLPNGLIDPIDLILGKAFAANVGQGLS